MRLLGRFVFVGVFVIVIGLLFWRWSQTDGRLLLAKDRGYQGLTFEQEGGWQGPYFFVQMTDSQIGMWGGGGPWERELDLLREAVQHINRLGPRFVAMTGDLVQSRPGEEHHQEQNTAFREVMSQIDSAIPLMFLCGNHDVGNRCSPETIEGYTRQYGDDYFSFWVGGVRYLVLNSNLLYDSTDAPQQYDQQNRWLASQLQAAGEARPAHLIVFMHHPLFLRHAHEGNDKFTIPKKRRMPLLRRFDDAGVGAVFSGHYHGNIDGQYGDMAMVTTTAIGMPVRKEPAGFRIVKVYRDRIEHQFYPLDAMPDAVTFGP